MAMQVMNVEVTGINPVLLNNPQCVDRFNKYSKEMARINDKGKRRTDDDYLELRDIEMRSKIYFDEELKIYVPSTWVSSSIAKNSFNVAKLSKEKARGAVFTTENKIKLHYDGMNTVLTEDDIVGNHNFRHLMTLKQGASRVVKAIPIFKKWHFATTLEFDDKIIDPSSLGDIIRHGAKYGGYGDFRPTFGRATVEIEHDR